MRHNLKCVAKSALSNMFDIVRLDGN